MELHAWFNPFRAGNAGDTLRLAATHVWNARRDLARRYGSQLWMDPGLPEVHERTVRVIRDVVRRYDVDAVHLDDYFYPYLERDAQNRIIDFPDSLAYARENPRGLSRPDWRRDNVNRFVERLYREVHEERPWVRVGISPFGIWRPGSAGGAPGTAGLDAFAEIYADSRLWLSRGWVDYLAPQLYWRIDAAQQSYPTLLGWWAQQNTQRRHLWPGNAAYRVYEAGSLFTPAELVSQVTATRAAGATGNVFYNATATLARNGGEVAAALAGSVYREPAVPPATPWLDATPPARPTIHVAESAGQGGERVYTVTPGAADADVRWWVVRWRGGGVWSQRVVRGTEPAVAVSSPAPVDVIALHAADRVWNAGEPAVWRPTAAVAAVAAVR
jgi:uncharacterized lipoprotein YddW (UPF0748 family)